jgi:predicted SpoU family rRNA methylase
LGYQPVFSVDLRDPRLKLGLPRSKGNDKTTTTADPFGMTARKIGATAWWLVGGLHPTLRKVREGWGTRFVVAARRRQQRQQILFGDDRQKNQQIPPPFDYAQGTE